MTTIIISADEVTIVSKSEEKSSKQDFHPGYTWRTNDSFAMAGFYAKAGQECGVDVILDNRTFGQDDRKVGGVAVYTKGDLTKFDEAMDKIHDDNMLGPKRRIFEQEYYQYLRNVPRHNVSDVVRIAKDTKTDVLIKTKGLDDEGEHEPGSVGIYARWPSKRFIDALDVMPPF
jgi:hypothetical protein